MTHIAKLTEALETIGKLVDTNALKLPRDEWDTLNNALLAAYSIRHKAARRQADALRRLQQ